MHNERFKIFTDLQTNEENIVDMVSGEPLTINETCDKLNELTELLTLVAGADSIFKRESVKEILEDHIEGLDTVAENSYNAYNDYCRLSKFYNEYYKK